MPSNIDTAKPLLPKPLLSKPLLLFVCAYHQEALPLIEHFKLKKNTQVRQLAYYQREQLALIETGAGKLNAASATAYIAGKYQLDNSAWLNIGIAGHATHAIGDGFLCHKITDANTLQHFYPDMRFKGELSSEDLLSVDKPENDYPLDCLYDMEAAGFFSSVSRFTTIEHIQCYKLVSDNKNNNASKLKFKDSRELINRSIEPIEKLASTLCSAIECYQATYQTPEEYDHYITQQHFTVTQQEQLKSLLKRWHALSDETLLAVFPAGKYHNSKQLLVAISNHVDAFSNTAIR